MVDMASYLAVKTADYTTTELSVTPHSVLTEEGIKNQILHEFDDGSVDVVTLSDSYFTVTLQWDWLNSTDKNTILDMFHSASKANGMAKTFYWHHPLETNIYVARFMSAPKINNESDKPGAFVIPEVTLRIEGKKA